MAELVRLTETGPQHQAAGAAPHWPCLSCWPGRPHRFPCSLWQESSESTNTTIEDEDTKGRGGLAFGVWVPGPPGRPPSLTAPGLEGPQHHPCVWSSTEYLALAPSRLSTLVVHRWTSIVGVMYLLCVRKKQPNISSHICIIVVYIFLLK